MKRVTEAAQSEDKKKEAEIKEVRKNKDSLEQKVLGL